MHEGSVARPVTTALYVDFDNIMGCLNNQDREAGDRFGTTPDVWLAWLQQALPALAPVSNGLKRRIVIRRCYLNPQAWGRYRSYFIRCAFEVVDCPPLTQGGKTSTDIRLVMDALDALALPANIDEFILLSADADFTPLLLRLRAHGRYTATLSFGTVSPALRSACDYQIVPDDFIREALQLDSDAAAVPAGRSQISVSAVPASMTSLLDRMGQRLYDCAAVPGGVIASELPGLYVQFTEFRQSQNWLGFGTLYLLTHAIVARRLDLDIVNADPWRVERHTPVLPPEGPAQNVGAPTDGRGSPEPAGLVPLAGQPVIPLASNVDYAGLRESIQAWLVEIVRAATGPTPLAALADGVVSRFGERVRTSEWLGYVQFKALLQSLDLDGLRISSVVPGFLYDPVRHMPPSPAGEGGVGFSNAAAVFAEKWPDVGPLAWRIHRLTDMPYLPPDNYGLMLREIARFATEEAERGFSLTEISKTVRDRCLERGAPVARAHVNFVLSGLRFVGFELGQTLPEDPCRVGEAVVENIYNLCRTAQFDLTDEERVRVREWIMGGLEPA